MSINPYESPKETCSEFESDVIETNQMSNRDEHPVPPFVVYYALPLFGGTMSGISFTQAAYSQYLKTPGGSVFAPTVMLVAGAVTGFLASLLLGMVLNRIRLSRVSGLNREFGDRTTQN